jgi:hypothetical protein
MSRCAAEVLEEAFYLHERVGIGVWLFRERPHVGDFDEDLRIAGKGYQKVELLWLVEW